MTSTDFFEFLGPAVANLNYWGETDERERGHHHQRKLDLLINTDEAKA